MNTIYIITVDTRHGMDVILVKTEPTQMDLGRIENYYLTQFDLHNVSVDYHEKHIAEQIATDVKDWIHNELYQNFKTDIPPKHFAEGA